jgi:hypothetical protein
MTTTLAIFRTSEQQMESAVVGRSGRWHCPAAYNPDHGPWFFFEIAEYFSFAHQDPGRNRCPVSMSRRLAP